MKHRMNCCIIDPHGKTLREGSISIPHCPPGHVRIRRCASGVNRADLLQVEGRYPLPEAQGMVPGLEVSGTIDTVGEGVTGWHIGDRVAALLEGGGYAEYVLADARHCLPVAPDFPLDEAAALPEALATAWYGLHTLGGLRAGERVLIHGGASGVGVIAIQLARHLGATVYTTARTTEKAALCASLGAQAFVTHDLTPDVVAAQIRDASKADGGSEGIDIILDMLGGEWIAPNLSLLRTKGRLISIACMSGADVSLRMGGLLMKNLRWEGMTLRSQTPELKAQLMAEIRSNVWPAIMAGEFSLPIAARFPLTQAADAHALMHSRAHMGKILLT